MKTILSLVSLFFFAVVAAAETPQVVPVGKGSYASFPPIEAGAKEFPTRDVNVMDANQPIPTNKWWTWLLTNKFPGVLWTFPHQINAGAEGIEMMFPTRWNEEGRDPMSEFPLVIGGDNFKPKDGRAKSWGDWTLTFRLAESDTKFVDVTQGRGIPALWLEYSGVKPTIKAGGWPPPKPGEAKFLDETGASLAFPAQKEAIVVEFGGRYFGVYASKNTTFTRDGETVKAESESEKSVLVVCPLPKIGDLAYFQKFAFAIPRDSKISWNYSPDKANVTTKWHLETEALQGTEKRAMQGWLPHHWRQTRNDFKFDGHEFFSSRGALKTAPGNDWTITYPFKGFLPYWPAPRKTGLANDFDPARMKDYLARFADRVDTQEDSYWNGKQILFRAQYMIAARQLNDPSYPKLRDSLKAALVDWFTYTPGEKARYFARYPKWRALVGFKASYGSEQFNDQHFHYGYFTQSAALLGMCDPRFLKDYGPIAKLIAKEYANWEREETQFPFLRHFDAWAGHSWANGMSTPGGQNQESTSEAIQSWAGVFLLGQALGDAKMSAAGAMGYAMETRAAREYWFNEHGDNWGPTWKHPVVGILWGGGQQYTTFFSNDPAWIFGIQWFPMSPALDYLVENREFSKNHLRMMFEARKKAPEASAKISTMGTALGTLVLARAAQLNPDWVAGQMDELWAKNDPVARDNDTPGLVYYQAHSNRLLGQIQWDYSMNLPLSRVYFNPATKKTTFVAFNPTNKPQAVQVFKAGQKIGTFQVAANQLKCVQQLVR